MFRRVTYYTSSSYWRDRDDYYSNRRWVCDPDGDDCRWSYY